MSDDSHSVRPGDGFGPSTTSGAVPGRHANGEWIDDVLDTLSDEYRRYVLYYLRSAPAGEASVDALLDGVSTALAENRDENRSRVVTSLVHSGLPKLVDVGLIEYDARGEAVRFPGDPFVEVLLDVTANRELESW